MAATNFTPIQLYYSTTASAVPLAANLAAGELAINVPDGKLYYNDSGTVKLLASNSVTSPVLSFSAGTTGFTPSTATTGAITLAGTLATTNGGTGLTSFTSGTAIYASSSSALTSGTLPTTGGGTGLTSFTSGGAVYASSTSALTTGTLPVASGGTGNTSLTANTVLLGNGTSALQTVSPSTNGNVLTSNGTTWVSQAPAASGITTGKAIAMAMIFGF